ncbi:MAG: hypothetical protein FJ039_10420 [Chloroflexi bacterium]|nr:hypothetical protein [Chloroflexota bacterium]
MAKWTIARLSRSGLAQRIRAPAEAGPYQTLLDEIVAGLGLSWPLFIALLLILPYVSAVLIVWVSIGIDELPTGAWRNLALPGVLMAYVAFAYRVNLPARKKRLEAFRKVVQASDEEYNALIRSGCTLRRSHEALAIAAGVIVGLFVMSPWDPGEKTAPSFIWTLISFTVMFGMIGWLIFQGLANTMLMTVLHRKKLNIDILNPEPVQPMAIWSLRVAVGFFGGITVSLIFLSRGDLLERSTLTVYSILGLAALLVFFFTLRSTHRQMASVKQREAKRARERILACAERLKRTTDSSQSESVTRLSAELSAWTVYERHILEASSWPFSTTTLQRLALATMTPALVYAAKVAASLFK